MHLSICTKFSMTDEHQGIRKLTRGNYMTWKLAVKYVPEELQVWNVVSGLTERPAEEGPAQAEWDGKDFKGRATMVKCLDAKHLRLASHSTTAAEMWQKLSDEHEISNSSRNVKHKFINQKVTAADSIIDFVERVKELGVELQGTAESVTELQQVLQVLDNLTRDYDLVKCSFHRQDDLIWRRLLPTLLNAECIIRKRQEERPSEEALLSRGDRHVQHNWTGVSHSPCKDAQLEAGKTDESVTIAMRLDT